MAELDPEILRQIMPTLPKAKRELYAPMIDVSAAEFGIDNERRVAAYLANLAHESMNLTNWMENLSYRAARLTKVWPKRFPTIESATPYAHNPEALANKVYGGRMGNDRPGDGWKYRGRGPIQITGKSLYLKASHALNVPALYSDPDSLMDDPMVWFRVAAWVFAVEKGGNQLADRNQIKALRKAINGGYNGLDEVVDLYNRALRVLPDGFRLTAHAQIPKEVDDTPDFIAGAEDNETEPEHDEEGNEPKAEDVKEETSVPAASGPKTTVPGQPPTDPNAPAVQINTATASKESSTKRMWAWLSMSGTGALAYVSQASGLLKDYAGILKWIVLAALVGALVYLIFQGAYGLFDRWTAYQLNKLQARYAADRTTNTVQFVPPQVGEKG